MTAAPHDIDPQEFLHEHLAQASPDLLAELMQMFVNALLSGQAAIEPIEAVQPDPPNRSSGMFWVVDSTPTVAGPWSGTTAKPAATPPSLPSTRRPAAPVASPTPPPSTLSNTWRSA